MTTPTIPTGRFVWFEYISKDLDKAQGFFGELFNWKTQTVPMPGAGASSSYTMISVDGVTIGGYLPPPPNVPAGSFWLSHLQVANAHATADKVKSLGGTIMHAPTKMGDFGTYAVVVDPTGAAFALWQPGKPEGTGDFKDKPNTWCWNELMTSDPAKAIPFYEAIAGFTDAPMDMGPMGTYHVMSFDGKGRAGIMKQSMAGAPTAWLPYLQVTNADAILAKATKLGAKVVMPAMDVPEVGRIAVFLDPNQAAIGILQPPAAK